MKIVLCTGIWLLVNATFGQTPMQAEKFDPNIGYVYPAGAQRGMRTTVTIGGQYMEEADRVLISGEGVRVSVVGYDRPISNREALQMGNKLKAARLEMGIKEGERPSMMQMMQLRDKTGITREMGQKMEAFANIRRDPKYQGHPAIAEELVIELVIDPDAKLGRRELRVIRDGRISGPIAFYIGDHPERTESTKADIEQTLPVVLNGQIMPGETDRWSFDAAKGEHLIIAAAARELIPHLADAVPGWFQSVITLYDADGKELVYADDYQFNPDPLLSYKIPADGTYAVEIRDSIHRGRQDFVYRITIGELPLVTSIFPLGGKTGEKTSVKLEGENLRRTKISVGDESLITTVKGAALAYAVPFAHSELPELLETEPNNTAAEAMPVQLNCVLNGRIEKSGDRDVFAIPLEKGTELLAKVIARSLNSPLDSVLMITDASGKQLAFNNDFEDPANGRQTHHADARILFTAPQTGTYYLQLGDVQNGGGSEYAYRLQLDAPQPNFSLRATPSSLNGVPGSSIPLTVYALREDGFDGEIELDLHTDIQGLRLDGARIPAGQNQVKLTVTLPAKPLDGIAALELEGTARIQGKSVKRLAVPAEDMMQAFIYHHLIPAEELLLSNIENRYPSRIQAECDKKGTLQLRRGKTTQLTFHAATWFGPTQRKYELEALHLPTGVTIEEFSTENNVIKITLRTDRSAECGLEGNLLFNQAVDHQMMGKNQEGERGNLRITAGPLPAVPFRIK